ncbi:MAG: hydrogenase maturation nickel metallochaperone HypA [Polyangia bacterium]|jgi:hydrogenase nickel incorporation protein HypA/HybF
MHELAIASAVIDRARSAAEEHGGAQVTRIGLRIGEIAGVEVDALRFSFEVLCRDTPLQAAVLDIELCKRKQRCASCSCEFEPVGLGMTCPSCGGLDSACVAGKELDVTFVELEVADEDV